MREIKFKAIRIDGEGWIVGDLLRDGSKTFIRWMHNPRTNDFTDCEVLPETVCQLIGELKGGVKVWEGDIITHGETTRFIETRHGNTSATRMDKSSTILLTFCENPKHTRKNIHDDTGIK